MICQALRAQQCGTKDKFDMLAALQVWQPNIREHTVYDEDARRLNGHYDEECLKKGRDNVARGAKLTLLFARRFHSKFSIKLIV